MHASMTMKPESSFWRRWSSVRGKKGKMARTLVWLCITVLLIAAVWGMVVKTISPGGDLTDVLTFIGGAFGFELLALLCKRLLAKPKEWEEENE